MSTRGEAGQVTGRRGAVGQVHTQRATCRRSRPSCSTASARSTGLARAAPHRRYRAGPPAAGARPGRRARRPARDLQPLVRAAVSDRLATDRATSRRGANCARPTASSCSTASAAGPARSSPRCPTVVFVIVNAITGLRPAIIAAVATAVVLAGYRLVRKQSMQQALSGPVRRGHRRAHRRPHRPGPRLLPARDLEQLPLRRPVRHLGRRPPPARRAALGVPRPVAGRARASRTVRGTAAAQLLRAYTSPTLLATVLFLARGIVQPPSTDENATGWLAFARIAMGYPLYIAADRCRLTGSCGARGTACCAGSPTSWPSRSDRADRRRPSASQPTTRAPDRGPRPRVAR